MPRKDLFPILYGFALISVDGRGRDRFCAFDHVLLFSPQAKLEVRVLCVCGRWIVEQRIVEILRFPRCIYGSCSRTGTVCHDEFKSAFLIDRAL